jgi:hypothetical protein
MKENFGGIVGIAPVAKVPLLAVPVPIVDVVPMTLEAVRKKKILEVEAGFQAVFMRVAHAPMGYPLVGFGAGIPVDRHIWTARRAAHDELPVAHAYLRHGPSSSCEFCSHTE